jgi:hypothetical protein
MHRTFTNASAVLYVNGVAVAGTTNAYNTTALAANIVFGASTDQSTNFFQGQLDNFAISVAGDNSATSGGKNYGTVNLATDNDFIRQTLVGKPAGDVDLSGSIGPNDVTVFVANWLKSKQVNGITVGDITTRALGDLNFNGIVDIDDAYILHHALVGAGAGALDASLLSGIGLSAPEPSSIVLALFSLAGVCGFVRRSRR